MMGLCRPLPLPLLSLPLPLLSLPLPAELAVPRPEPKLPREAPRPPLVLLLSCGACVLLRPECPPARIALCESGLLVCLSLDPGARICPIRSHHARSSHARSHDRLPNRHKTFHQQLPGRLHLNIYVLYRPGGPEMATVVPRVLPTAGSVPALLPVQQQGCWMGCTSKLKVYLGWAVGWT